MKRMRAPSLFNGRSAVTQRLLKGFGANSLGKIWALLIQLVSVPVLTSAWGVEGYGVWLMIATIPVYLGLSDFGLGTAAGVDMTAAMTSNDRRTALRAFQSVWLFMTAITVAVAVIVISGALTWGHRTEVLSEQVFTPKRTAIAIALITLAALLMVQMSVLKMIFQATHKYALGTIIYDFASLAEGLTVIIVAVMGGDILIAAAGMLCIRLIALMICMLILSRLEPWCRPGWAMADLYTLRRLMRPSMAALALTLANSFGLQGVVLTIGWAMGPAVAAIFATTRMLTRIPLQFSTLLSRASLPELTRAQVEGREELTRRLMRVNVALTMVSVFPCFVILAIWGPELLSWLSHGEMVASSQAFVLLGMAATFNALWSTLGVKLIATNRQSSFAWVVLLLYAATSITPLTPDAEYLIILALIALFEGIILLKVWMANKKIAPTLKSK